MNEGANTAVDPAMVTRLRVAVGRLNRQLGQRVHGALTFAQLSALVAITERGPIRLGELAQAEQVAAPSMSRTLAGLIAGGMVRKEQDPRDGRSCYLVLTDAGRELVKRIKHERSAALAERLTRITADQYAALEAAVPVLELIAADEPDRQPERTDETTGDGDEPVLSAGRRR